MNLWLTAEQIAESTSAPIGTIYWLAHRDGWRRTRTKPRGYWVEDVAKTMRARLDRAA